MSIYTTYPGIYIQELPSLVHAITPAPTSIAVFIGYTNPFANPPPGDYSDPNAQREGYSEPIQLFSFADYQANFGGFFSSPWQPDYMGQAVFQFFENGGQTCYVVSLQAESYWDFSTTPPTMESLVSAASADAQGIIFTARQPVGDRPDGVPMSVKISNVQNSSPSTSDDMADIVITYGTTVETYRKVPITDVATLPPDATLAPGQQPPPLQASSLVAVALSSPAPAAYPAGGGTYSLSYDTQPQPGWTVINPVAFAPVFAADAALDKVPVFNLLVTPGITDDAVTSEAVAFCERKRAFYIMDTPSPETNPDWTINSMVQGGALSLSSEFPVSPNAALYYPWLKTTDPVTGVNSTAPPSGFVAGMYGQEDTARGVWKSPAGIETALLGTTGVVPHGVMSNNQQGVLNQEALNCLRQFPGIGTVIFGARTTAGATANTAQQQWRYVAVRRMALFIEQTLYANLTWAVFEGNSTPLWHALTQEVTAFMLSLFREGAFAGDTPSTAFLVQCDNTTTTADDIANGIVNIVVGFAPLVPAEFVIVKIAQLAGQAQS
jgi:phage tail sheath protein FI